MDTSLKYPSWGRNSLAVFIGIGIAVGSLPAINVPGMAENSLSTINLEQASKELDGKLVILQNNSLMPVSDPDNPDNQIKGQVRVVITAYSSTPLQTDSTPYITAAGTWVRDGIIANNYFPMGTKIKIPELYGEKVFVVEDRMNRKKGDYQIDIWLPSYQAAKNFGAKNTYIEILEG